jgi:hypothetical protein
LGAEVGKRGRVREGGYDKNKKKYSKNDIFKKMFLYFE